MARNQDKGDPPGRGSRSLPGRDVREILGVKVSRCKNRGLPVAMAGQSNAPFSGEAHPGTGTEDRVREVILSTTRFSGTDFLTRTRKGTTTGSNRNRQKDPSSSETADHLRSTRLSDIDKKILKILLQPGAKISSVDLEKELGIPRSTIQRRRRHLERSYLEHTYVLKLEHLGFRRVDLFIYTGGGATGSIAKELLNRDEVVYVGSSIGEHTIDLRAEVIIRDNSELLNLLELVKAMPSVRDVVWSEIVEVLGRKTSIPPSIIDRL
ncbi:MAG: winged helix-turn-helix transcriptional regulator [Thaumarchaeota archaeon]|nr:winged helix-turn-helix transcriptional regulator [Nitrososphaerota archaeon]